MQARVKKCLLYENLYYVQVKNGWFWKDYETNDLSFLIKIAKEFYSPLEVKKRSVLFTEKQYAEQFINKYLNASSGH
jgi:hypothetical protein